ncbi:acyltransferase family protein [Algoriphagus taiwanensis]|uniref:Acyltransferase 3 domain-containing protein n=1 Tax=Algoriphagus taiwanensis TaxID=1445656 RepID=A0ABQ6Q1P6_9BACT|nr:hypothetical protein Ataiwa_20790 [Algoriphagus taiwanensis]
MKFSSLFENLIRKPQSGKFIPFIDGLRFLAIVPVLFQHANERLHKYGTLPELSQIEEWVSFFISRGTIGVFLFFAISGFILSLPFAQGRTKEKYSDYLKRRLFRIEPPFLLWMTVFALVLLIKGDYPGAELLRHFLATITYTHQFFYGEYSIINPVAWSLEVEIQFYLIAPFLASAYFGIRNTRERRALLIWGLFCFILFQHGMGWQLMPFKPTLLGQFPHFLVGMLAADLYTQPLRGIRKSYLWDALFPVLVLTLAFTWSEELGKMLVFELALLLVFISSFYGKILGRFLSLQWIVIIGGMCYSLYLIHLPLMEAFYLLIGKFGQWSGYFGQLSITLIVVLPMILFSGVIAYRWIEQPFMKRQKSKKPAEKTWILAHSEKQ